MKIYDATDQIVGRMSTAVAKQLLSGEKISIVNAEKAVLAGNPKWKTAFYMKKIHRGDPSHGPFFPRQPQLILRRTIRGMIPWDRTRGRNAFKNLKVFIGVPEEFQGKQFEKISLADASKLKIKSITLGDLAIQLGAKRRW